LVLTFYIDVYL